MTTDILGALGSGSGINTTQLVQDLVSAQKAPQQGRLDARTETADAKLSAYGVLKSALASFESVLTPLSDAAIFNAKSINVPTTDVLTFNSLTEEAQAGSYQIEVEQTAASQSLAFNVTETDAGQALGNSGTLTFSTGTWDDSVPPAIFTESAAVGFDVVISDDDSLDDMAEKINAVDSGVLASVITIDGKLQLLISAESGEDNALQITSDVLGQLAGFEYNAVVIAAQDPLSPTVVQTQQGQDALFKLNGLSISRDSNNITDVIPGLDFTLDKADVGNNIAFSIAEDKSSAEEAIRALVEAYNTLLDIAGPLVGVSTDEDNNTVTGGLAKDGSAKSLVRNLTQAISSAVIGMDSTNGYSSLAAVGVTTDLDGTLLIDEEQFEKIISENFDKLPELFGLNTSSSSNFIELNEGSFAAQAVAGDYTVDITQSPTKGYVTGSDISATYPIDLTDGSSNFTVQVNGTSSASITLSGTYNTDQELTAALQSAINSDSVLSENNISVDVSIDSGALKISSREYGSSSSVLVVAESPSFLSKLGLSSGSVVTAGINAEGTINGKEAFGASNILLPEFGSDAYGLNLIIAEGTPLGEYTVSFTRGLAGDLALFVSSILADGGQIDRNEGQIETEKVNITDDQKRLDRKMTAYQERLSSQYVAMERIIASLSSTESQLDGLIDRLPFTASN